MFLSVPKEPHYFAHDFPHYRAGLPTLEAYLALFSDVTPQCKAVGEASVWYLYSQVAIGELRAFAPDARLIVMTRDPVELVQSIHQQLIWTLDEDETDFAKAWALQEQRKSGKSIPFTCRQPAFLAYRDVAMLGHQVSRLLKIFPREQVCFVRFESFSRSPREQYLRVLDHLGLKDDGRRMFPKVNERKESRHKFLQGMLQRPPPLIGKPLGALKQLLGVKRLGWRSKLLRLNAVSTTKKPLSNEFRVELESTFARDVEMLNELVGPP